MKRPDKVADLRGDIFRHLTRGSYLDTRHALGRQIERAISRPEIIHVLKHGYHERRKDHFDKAYRSWNYAVRGKTMDNRELRIVVSFDEHNMLIITAIDMSLGG